MPSHILFLVFFSSFEDHRDLHNRLPVLRTGRVIAKLTLSTPVETESLNKRKIKKEIKLKEQGIVSVKSQERQISP